MRYKYIYKPTESLYITTEEAAKMLRVGTKTVQRWCSEGKIKAVKPGKAWLINRKDIEGAYEM